MAEDSKVKEFEDKLAAFYGIDEIMCTNSCTSAIIIALRCIGIREGDEIITTPLTCIATNIPIMQLGGRIRWADVNKNNGMINSESVKKLINQRTKAIIILHKKEIFVNIKRLERLLMRKKYQLLKIVLMYGVQKIMVEEYPKIQILPASAFKL